MVVGWHAAPCTVQLVAKPGAAPRHMAVQLATRDRVGPQCRQGYNNYLLA